MRKTFKLLTAIGFIANLTFPAFAEDAGGTIPIDLNIPKPNKPKAPSYVQLSAYYDGSSIVVSSNVSVTAGIEITDALSDQCYFSTVAMLAPDYSCPVTAAPGSALIITVTVGSTIYEGILML